MSGGLNHSPVLFLIIITACFMCQTSPYLQVFFTIQIISSYLIDKKVGCIIIMIIIPTRLLSNSIVTWNLFPYQRDVKQFDTQLAAFSEGEQRWKKKIGELSSSVPPQKKKPRIRKIQFPCVHDSSQCEYQLFTSNLKYFESIKYHN